MRKRKSITLTLMLGFAFLASWCQAAILVEFQQGKIPGNSLLDKYDKSIEFDSVQWGAGRAISPALGGGDREYSNPSFSEISLSRSVDERSPLFFYEAAVGTPMTEIVKIHFLQTFNGGPSPKLVEYMTIELSNVMISSISHSASADGTPSESISLNFTQIVLDYAIIDMETGQITGHVRRGFDLVKNLGLPSAPAP